MQAKTLLLVTLLALGAVAAAPAASAEDVTCGIDVEAWQLACRTADGGVHYAKCYLYTAPIDWLTDCV